MNGSKSVHDAADFSAITAKKITGGFCEKTRNLKDMPYDKGIQKLTNFGTLVALMCTT
jgi:hypothetical protein